MELKCLLAQTNTEYQIIVVFRIGAGKIRSVTNHLNMTGKNVEENATKPDRHTMKTMSFFDFSDVRRVLVLRFNHDLQKCIITVYDLFY